MTQDSQEDKEKEMQNIIEDKDRISEKIGEFQKKYNQKSINENDNAIAIDGPDWETVLAKERQ